MTDQPPSQQNNAYQPGVAVDIFSGTGLGLLLGTVVGLSVTPIVTIVVGALTSLLAVFLGLDGGKGDDGAAISKIRLNGVRIGSFGIATVLGIMMGLWIRAHQPFELPLNEHLKRWEGIPPETAHLMVIYERTGLKPNTITAVEGGHKIEVSKAEGLDPRGVSILKASHAEGGDLCGRLAPKEWANIPEDILNFYKDQSELTDNKLFEAISTSVGALPKDQQMKALEAARKLICQLEGDNGP